MNGITKQNTLFSTFVDSQHIFIRQITCIKKLSKPSFDLM